MREGSGGVGAERRHVVIGVDTHNDMHVAVAIDELGRRIAHVGAPATASGYDELVSWAEELGAIRGFTIEGCGSYGMGLVRQLHQRGVQVHQVDRPARRRERRRVGKTDLIDAEHAARLILSDGRLAVPKAADGVVEMIRLVKVARDTAVKAQVQAMITLKSLLITADDGLRADLGSLTDRRLIEACAGLEAGALETTEAAMCHALSGIALRWLALHEEVKTHARSLRALTKRAAPQLLELCGIGFDTAAQMLIVLGDNGERVRSEPAFAKMCGACPIPASSGKIQRHRLYRGGDRQANAALHRVVIVRLRWHEPTRAYAARRTAEGRTKKEIIRCLKRYVAREIFNALTPTHTGANGG
jgi:transposase